ncbi:hypothetical protein LINPERHAP1_LOCUS16238, partial [Linum perenne]
DISSFLFVLDCLQASLTIGACRFDRIESLRPDHGVEITKGNVESSSLLKLRLHNFIHLNRTSVDSSLNNRLSLSKKPQICFTCFV